MKITQNTPNKKGELQQLNNFVLFQAEHGKVNIDVYFQDETLWLSQKAITAVGYRVNSHRA